MRTVPFRTVYESIVRRLGYNPRAPGEPKEDVAQTILVHFNDQVRYAWGVWEWPELNAIEWRAFRKVWTPSVQVNVGEDVYYLGDGVTVPPANLDLPTNWPGNNEGYYNCFASPPPGTLPTNTLFFNKYGGTVLTSQLLDRYIAYAQPNQNIIGDLLDVYQLNPRETTTARIIKSAPSSKGIDVPGTGFNVVWIRYRIPESQFTLTPLMPGDTGTIVRYDPVQGDCFSISVSGNSALQPPAFPGGTLIPFPIFLKGFVQQMTYAEVLLETNSESVLRMRNVEAAMLRAENYLQREIDKLAEQGQKLQYPAFPSRRRHHGTRLGNINWDQGDIPFEQTSTVVLTQN